MVMAMGKVNKEALERALNSLAADGAISGWQRRPLNMYMIALASGEVIRPDAKETAMWVQGVMYAKLATAQQEAPPASRPVDRDHIATALDNLVESEILQQWGQDDDDDYVMVHRDGTARSLWADQTLSWAVGVAHGADLARLDREGSAPEADLESVAPLLDLLVHQDVLTSWSVDEDGDFLLISPASGSQWIYNNAIAAWLKGAVHTFKETRTISEDQREVLRGWFHYLRQVGPLDGWEADEIGEYRIWSGGDKDSLNVPGNLALTWAMGAVEATQWFWRRMSDDDSGSSSG